MASVINKLKIGTTEYAIASTAYAECSTDSSEPNKTATICTDGDTTNTSFTLIKGVSINVKFSNTNEAATPTLNINNTGAKAIQYRNAAVGQEVLVANRIYTFTYDGSAWQLVTPIDWTLSALKATLLDTIYPVGSIYISVSETSPASFLGGTWDKIEDAYLYAKLSTETAGSMYGDTDYKISTAQLPTHTHTMAHTHTGPSHSHSLNNHTHPITITSSGAHAHNTTSEMSGATEAKVGFRDYGDPGTWIYSGNTRVSVGDDHTAGTWGNSIGNDPNDTMPEMVTIKLSHTHSVTSAGSAHTHIASSSASSTTTTGAAGTGTTGEPSKSYTGAVGSSSEYKPKYLAVIVWKRTA